VPFVPAKRIPRTFTRVAALIGALKHAGIDEAFRYRTAAVPATLPGTGTALVTRRNGEVPPPDIDQLKNGEWPALM